MILTLKVEVAFNAGYATAAGSRTWTDITSYVELADGIDIEIGRRDEFTDADANTLSLTLDNSDGRFTPERSSSPYYPNVKLYRPIRVTATLPDASTSVRFLGFVTQWPFSWPNGSSGYSTTTLTAVSRIQRLGVDDSLRSVLEEENLASTPNAYYTLSAASGATSAGDSSGNGAPALTVAGTGAAVVFGNATGPGVDGLTAATFASGQYLVGSNYSFGVGAGIELWATLPAAAPASRQVIAAAGNNLVALVLETSGKVSAYFQLEGVLETLVAQTATSMLGGTHQFNFGYSGAGAAGLRYDGGSLSSTAVAGGLTGATGVVIGASATGSSAFTGSVSHVLLSPTGTDFPTRYTAGTTGFSGESVNARLTRLSTYAGVPSAETAFDVSTTLVSAQPISGSTPLAAMQLFADSDQGVLFDAASGALTFKTRAGRYSASVAFTLDASAQQLGSDYAPTYDQQKVINTATVTGDIEVPQTNATSKSDYGPSSATRNTAEIGNDAPLMLAGWLVNTYGDPKTRVTTLSADVLPLASGTPSVMNLAAATVGTLIQVSNLPTQAASSSAKFFVEGYKEHFTVESWVMTFNVSDASPFLNVWTVEDATLGQYDAYPIAL